MKVGDAVTVTIDDLAGLGDGVAHLEGRAVFVPFSAPGDVLDVQATRIAKDHIRAEILHIVEPSAARVPPPCPRFGLCGGCALQHLDAAHYAGFKMRIALDAARQLGAGAEVVRPLFQSGAGSRRRAEVKVAVEDGEVTLGFHATASHAVVDAAPCTVVDAALGKAIVTWRDALQTLKKPARIQAIHFTHADNGLEVVLHSIGTLKPADKNALIAFAQAQGVVRLALKPAEGEGELWLAGEPELRFGTAAVELPVGAFMQATARSQQAMVDAVLAHCRDAKAVADLYCGCGTFSLPLALAGHHLRGYEGSEPAVTALFNAARRHGLEGRLAATQRDIYAQPLTMELQGVDAVVINPPRNGALPQTQAIAAQGVPLVVMVSCNPATFLRDAKALVSAGYRLESLLPVDQFTWSPHLELVACLRRSAQ